MTRKDYIAIAAALRHAHRDIANKEAPEVQTDMRDGVGYATDWIVAALQRDNPRFDRIKFLAAVHAEEVQP